MPDPVPAVARRHRRANIVATLGPATSTPERVRELVIAGMDVARVNLAHGTHADHRQLCALAHATGTALGRPVAVLADVAGPKMRVGTFVDGRATLVSGDRFVITTEPCPGTASRASTGYADLARDVRAGNTILVDDGNIRLKVLSTDGTDVVTEVVEGGPISDHKGLNLPGVAVSAPVLSSEDVDALTNALEAGVDLVALSFVRRPSDADAVREVMAAVGRSVPVIAKIEKPEVLSVLPDIVAAFDGLMVARGDLGVEAPLEWVPIIQKRAINLARAPGPAGDRRHPDARVDDHPLAADAGGGVGRGQRHLRRGGRGHAVGGDRGRSPPDRGGRDDGPDHHRGRDGRPSRLPGGALRRRQRRRLRCGRCRVPRHAGDGQGHGRLHEVRPFGSTAGVAEADIAVIACTPDEEVSRQLALTWGVESILVEAVDGTDEMVVAVDKAITAHGIARAGEHVVIVAGTPVGADQAINTLRVHTVGQVR